MNRLWKLPGMFSPVQLTPAASGYLDIVRSLAAMAVFLDHWRACILADYGDVDPVLKTLPVKALYFLSGFGPQAVMIFFVLSGLFISSSVLRSLERGKWSWRDYAIDRAVRLYVVLIPALVLGALWDFLGIHFFSDSGVYLAIATRLFRWQAFLGSLFFVQTRFTPSFGSNDPLWSLFNEFWYYALFPVLLGLIIALNRRRLAALGYVGAAAAICWMLGGQIWGFAVWLAGGAVALTSRWFRFKGQDRWPLLAYTTAAGALAAICLTVARNKGGWLGSGLAVGVSFAFLTHGMVQWTFGPGEIGQRLGRIFAGFSYSLYLVHVPIVFLIRAVLMHSGWLPKARWQPDGVHLLIGAAVSAAVFSYAFALAQMTEARTSVVRSWVRNRVAHQLPAPLASSAGRLS